MDSIIQRKGPGLSLMSRLHDDILWHIFTLNTLDDADLTDSYLSVPKHDYSLFTARHTSHVCSRWRTLILASSSLWANTLNLEHLDQKNPSWRNEILKRTGKSLISVWGHVKEGTPATEFFLSLLRDHWTRLRRISVLLVDKQVGHDKRWLSVQRPAPNLEIFSIISWTSHFLESFQEVLFSNNAPSIHHIQLYGLNFDLSGLRLSHLRHLKLYFCSVGPRLNLVLAEMLSMETLSIVHTDIGNISREKNDRPTILLPKLHSLKLSLEFKSLLALLSHILPTPGCSSSFRCVSNTFGPFSAEDLDVSLLRRSFAAHFQCFLGQGKNDVLSWTLTDESFTLDSTIKEDDYLPDSSCFSFYLEVGDHAWGGLPFIILDSLVYCDFSYIKIFELDLSDAGIGPSNSNINNFLRTLRSVETIHIDSDAMKFLYKSQLRANEVILFPRLQTIVFDTLSRLKSDIALQFLLQRRDAGLSIKTLDLGASTSAIQDWLRFFEREGINGLDVI